MEKKIRGMYKIDYNKTPQENITEILKLTMPIKLTVNKMQGNGSSNGDYNSGFKMDGVTITAVDSSGYSINSIGNFKRIQFDVKIPGQHYGRRNSAQKKWSVRVHDDGKVSLSWIVGVFEDLSKLYEEGDAIEKERLEKIQKEQDYIDLIRQKSQLPKKVNLSYNANMKRFNIYVNFDHLSEEELLVKGPIFAKFVEDLKNA